MRRAPIFLVCAVVSGLCLSTALAQPNDSGSAAPARDPLLGIGYKVGNGIGFIGGDLIITPLPHLSLDLHAAWVPDFDSAFAIAPAVQAHLWPARSTPYAALGMQYVRATLGDVTASGNGFFANLGYEWKWAFGLGLQLGGGIQYLQEVTATDGTRMVRLGGDAAANIEFGVRYRFF